MATQPTQRPPVPIRAGLAAGTHSDPFPRDTLPARMAITRSDGTTPTPADKGHARAIWNRLRKRYPTIATALDYTDPWQLLVSTVLSAQTTDDTVNRVTPVLFARYPTPVALAGAERAEVEAIVFSTGFYRQKSAAVMELAADLVERFDGVVPDTIEALVTLKGVGRKTASVVLAEAWGKPAIAVDTHVRRVANRLGLTHSQDPVKIEQDLKAVFPADRWSGLSMRMIQFGRDVCDARRPRCPDCELRQVCPFPGKTV
jgi:endonuclease III